MNATKSRIHYYDIKLSYGFESLIIFNADLPTTEHDGMFNQSEAFLLISRFAFWLEESGYKVDIGEDIGNSIDGVNISMHNHAYELLCNLYGDYKMTDGSLKGWKKTYKFNIALHCGEHIPFEKWLIEKGHTIYRPKSKGWIRINGFSVEESKHAMAILAFLIGEYNSDQKLDLF